MLLVRPNIASTLLFALACSFALIKNFKYSSSINTIEMSIVSTNSSNLVAQIFAKSKYNSSNNVLSSINFEHNNILNETQKESSVTTIPFANCLTHTFIIQSGETISTALEKLKFGKREIHLASQALGNILNLRYIKPGTKITITAKKDGDKLCLSKLELYPNALETIIVIKNDSGIFHAEKTKKDRKKLCLNKTEKSKSSMATVFKRSSATINNKFSVSSLRKSGFSQIIAKEIFHILNKIPKIKAAKSDINIEVFYHDNYITSPTLVQIIIRVDEHKLQIYKFNHNGQTMYVDQNGQIFGANNLSKIFIIPVHGARISSHFGLRTINGKAGLHKGIDFAASSGTLVFASVSGTITKVAYYKGYGLLIQIKHSGGYTTRYAHLKLSKVKVGQKVKQGELIGISGCSGRVTGAHLHFEILVNGIQVNPMKYFYAIYKLSKKEKQTFQQFKNIVNLQMISLNKANKIESNQYT